MGYIIAQSAAYLVFFMFLVLVGFVINTFTDK